MPLSKIGQGIIFGALVLLGALSQSLAAGLGAPEILGERKVRLGGHIITADPNIPPQTRESMFKALEDSLNKINASPKGSTLLSFAPEIHIRLANRYNRYVGWHKFANKRTLVVSASFLLDKESRFFTQAITQELARKGQELNPQKGFADKGIQIVDGIRLVGSLYPDVKNRSFFKNVKRALEMGKKLSPKLQSYIQAVDEIRYNPPSRHFKKSGGIDGAVAYYNRTLSTPEKRIIFIRRKMLYSSPLDTLLSLVHEGTHVVQHEMAEKYYLKNKFSTASSKEVAYAETWYRTKKGPAANRAFVQKFECEATLNELAVAKKFDASPKVIESSQYMSVCQDAQRQLIQWKTEKYRRAKKG